MKNSNLIKAYLLNAINSEDKELSTDREKLEHVNNRFNSEYGHNITRYGSKHRAFTEWLQGLSLDIDFENYHILQLGERWGYSLKTESQKDHFLVNWFPRMAQMLIAMIDKEGLN